MEGRKRIVIQEVYPQIDCGRYPVKRIIGEEMVVRADIICDGHDELAAAVFYRRDGEDTWHERAMRPLGNDRWEGAFPLETIGLYHYTIRGWVDYFRSWQKELQKKFDAGQNLDVEFVIGIGYLEEAAEASTGEDASWLRSVVTSVKREGDVHLKVALCLNSETTRLLNTHGDRSLAATCQEFAVAVNRQKELFSTWYELFPRSWSGEPGRHGTFGTAKGSFRRSHGWASTSSTFRRFIRSEEPTGRERTTAPTRSPTTRAAHGR